MLTDSSVCGETSPSNDSPSLVDLPPEIIVHIIRMLPQSPYYKCLNVCKHLDAIENTYTVKRCVMCICRVHKDSPNLPSQELKLFLCRKFSSSHLDTFIEIITRQPPTCKTTVYGRDEQVDVWDNYFRRYDCYPYVEVFRGCDYDPNVEAFRKYDYHPNVEALRRHEYDPNVGAFRRYDYHRNVEPFIRYDCHPYVKDFIRNCQTLISSDFKYGFSCGLILGLGGEPSSSSRNEFITDSITITLGENHDTVQQFCKTLIGSCFHRVTIHCNNVNFLLFNDYLKRCLHISDALHFYKTVEDLNFDQIMATPFPSNFLNDLDNLRGLSLTMNEEDLENLKSRLSELTHAFKQANLQNLEAFSLNENSSIEYIKDLMPLWVDFLYAIPSNKLQRLGIRSKSIEYLAENHTRTQSESNGLSLAHVISRFTLLRYLTIHHLGFDSTLLTTLSSLPRLRILNLRINMDMSNNDVIDKPCLYFENCNKLSTVTLYFSTVAPMIFDNIFVSLAKLQERIVLSLYFDSLKSCPAYECFNKLELMKNLQQISVDIGRKESDETNAFSTTIQKLEEKIEQIVPRECRVCFQFNTRVIS